MNRKERGNQAELIAEEYLCAHGLKLREKNFYTRLGEIDLIMQDGDTIVFVEVRYRSSNDFGGALASVNSRKQKKIALAALRYLQKQRLHSNYCRFDVVSVSRQFNEQSKIDWIQNAFEHRGKHI